MPKTEATHLLTRPQREAVIELARAYAMFTTVCNQHVKGQLRRLAARHLREAQGVFGIELQPDGVLEAMESEK